MVIYRHNAVRCRRHADRREEVPHRLADKVGLTIGSLRGGGEMFFPPPRLCGRRVPTRLTRGCHRPFDFRVIHGTGGGFDLGASPRQVRVGASLVLRTRPWPSADRNSHICRSTSFEAPLILASRHVLRWKARFREGPSPLGGARARCATPTVATRPSAYPAALEGSIYCGVA